MNNFNNLLFVGFIGLLAACGGSKEDTPTVVDEDYDYYDDPVPTEYDYVPISSLDGLSGDYGEWVGGLYPHMLDTGVDYNSDVELYVQEDGIFVNYPDRECSSTLHLIEGWGRKWLFAENMTHGSCSDGFIKLTRTQYPVIGNTFAMTYSFYSESYIGEVDAEYVVSNITSTPFLETDINLEFFGSLGLREELEN